MSPGTATVSLYSLRHCVWYDDYTRIILVTKHRLRFDSYIRSGSTGRSPSRFFFFFLAYLCLSKAINCLLFPGIQPQSTYLSRMIAARRIFVEGVFNKGERELFGTFKASSARSIDLLWSYWPRLNYSLYILMFYCTLCIYETDERVEFELYMPSLLLLLFTRIYQPRKARDYIRFLRAPGKQ